MTITQQQVATLLRYALLVARSPKAFQRVALKLPDEQILIEREVPIAPFTTHPASRSAVRDRDFALLRALATRR